jgi:hypothetical protein
MKKLLITGCLIGGYMIGYGQELPANMSNQLEQMAEADESLLADADGLLLQWQYYQRHPLNINASGAAEWRELQVLNEKEIQQVLRYRQLMGDFISVYELLAVPGLEREKIRQLLPLICVRPVLLRPSFTAGQHLIVLQAAGALSMTNAQRKDQSAYLGSPLRLVLRYKYTDAGWQWGLTGEKDSGEQFFRGKQKTGFDFYSFHVFKKGNGLLSSLALGDYSISMGQGLIHWQGIGWGKGASAAPVAKRTAMVRAYTGTGESRFMRGAAAVLRKGNGEAALFASLRSLDASIAGDTMGFSSFITSGYHRTAREMMNKGNLRQLSAGVVMRYQLPSLQIGVNAIGHLYNRSLQKRDVPYNLYAQTGDRWYNLSIDHAGTIKNIHYYGELAMDPQGDFALLQGLLISAGREMDFSFVYRRIAAAYQAPGGQAFTENSSVNNETGLFGGVVLKPSPGWKMECYADVFRFPWLKYKVHAPSAGKDFFIQLTHTPAKGIEHYLRFRAQAVERNFSSSSGMRTVLTRYTLRCHLSLTVNKLLQLRQRSEMLWYDPGGAAAETGYAVFVEALLRPKMKPWSLSGRLQYYQTEGYNSRIYAYEQDLPYNYGIPAVYGTGYRWNVVTDYDLTKQFSVAVRCAGHLRAGTVTGTMTDPFPVTMAVQVRGRF